MKKFFGVLLIFLLFTACASKTAEQLSELSYRDSTLPVQERVEILLSRMTMQEKIGQMLQVDRYQIGSLQEVSKYMVGSVLNGGNSNPKPNTPEGWADMYDEVQKEALKTRLGIPVLYGIDAVHGNGRTPGAVIFPHNIGLGAANNPELAEQIGKITAIETRATGIHWTFAPCVAVPLDIRWGRTYEGFSEDTEIAASLGAATIRGLQAGDFSSFDSVLSCTKHYVGDGGTSRGKDQGDTIVDEETLRRIHLKPYIDAIAAGTATIMASFSSWNGEKIHGNSYLLTDVLRDELGFKGLVVSDWAAVTQLRGSYRSKLEKAINAGIDLIMLPAMPGKNLADITTLVEAGRISEDRINQAVRRILELKFKLGLFEHPFADRDRLALIGNESHREVARQAVRESAVLLKNNGVLPLSENNKKILVIGSKADDPGVQCGGWTKMWQGVNGEIEGATSLLDALIEAAGNTEFVFSEDGNIDGDFDAIILVVGEDPYAEGEGDDKELDLEVDESKIVKTAAQKDLPLIMVVLSGRPLLISDEIEMADAVLAAWLPGSEGDGIADILLGDYSPTGKLPFTWPANEKYFESHAKEDILYPLFYGLSY